MRRERRKLKGRREREREEKKKKRASIDAGLSRGGEAVVDRQAKQQQVTCSAEFASLCGPQAHTIE